MFINNGDSLDMISQDMQSCIDDKLTSNLSNAQEMTIPEHPVYLTQNKRLTALWFEAKKQIDDFMHSKNLMTTEEL